MGEQDNEIAPDGLPVAARHRLDLFDEIGEIKLVEAAFAQQRSLLLEPEQRSRS